MGEILQKYSKLDSRNFEVLRKGKSIKKQLIKYTGYYNQFGDILFCEENYLYPIKFNIAVGGFIGSGKSTLINTILGEKRCLEAQGCSQTNYISQYTLKDYPINFIDFPGFRAKKNGIDNCKLFINNIKSKINDLKRTNELIHCFLFCIKYEERFFDDKEEETKEIFKLLAKIKLKTFFIITQSEDDESDGFQRFKENLINQIETIYNKDEIKNVIGDDINEQIIPIFSIKKMSHGHMIKPFGLDKLFEALYKYFSDKKIDKHIDFNTINDNKLQELTKDNEFLKVFTSKKEIINGLIEKMKKEISSFIFRTFLRAPIYLYNLSDKQLEIFFVEALEKFINIYFFYINKQNTSEKIRLLEDINIPTVGIKDEIIKCQEMISSMKNDLSNIPWYIKTLFPILSPIYYTVGTGLIIIFSDKISNIIIDKVLKDDKFQNSFNNYFENIIKTINLAIDGLNIISKHFSELYSKNND